MAIFDPATNSAQFKFNAYGGTYRLSRALTYPSNYARFLNGMYEEAAHAWLYWSWGGSFNPPHPLNVMDGLLWWDAIEAHAKTIVDHGLAEHVINNDTVHRNFFLKNEENESIIAAHKMGITNQYAARFETRLRTFRRHDPDYYAQTHFKRSTMHARQDFQTGGPKLTQRVFENRFGRFPLIQGNALRRTPLLNIETTSFVEARLQDTTRSSHFKSLAKAFQAFAIPVHYRQAVQNLSLMPTLTR